MAEPQIKDYTEYADSSLASKGSLLGKIDNYESFVGEDTITEPDKLSEAEVAAIIQKLPPEMFKSGVITSQVIATARSGKRVEIDGVHNRINYYADDGDNGIRFITEDGTFVSDITTFFNSLNNASGIDTAGGGGSLLSLSGKSNLGNIFLGFNEAPFTTLNGSISTGATSIVLTDASAFAASGDGVTEDNLDFFSWTGKSSNTLTGVTGIDFSHTTGTTVTSLPTDQRGLFIDWSAGDLQNTATAYFNSRVAFTKTDVTLGATFTIDAQTDAQTSYLQLTAAAAVTSSVTTAIEDAGTTGQILILEGTDDTNTITILDGANTQLAGAASAVLGQYDTLTLIFNGTQWIELSRSNN